MVSTLKTIPLLLSLHRLDRTQWSVTDSSSERWLPSRERDWSSRNCLARCSHHGSWDVLTHQALLVLMSLLTWRGPLVCFTTVHHLSYCSLTWIQQCFCLSVCLSICLSVCLFVCLILQYNYVCLSVCQSIHYFISGPFYLFISLSVCVIHLLLFWPVH